jgi:hypothetical protein
MRTIPLLIACGLLFVVSVASAEEWVFVGERKNVSYVYVDNKNIKHVSEHVVSASVMYKPKRPEEIINFECGIVDLNIDCTRKTQKVHQEIHYFSDGTENTVSTKADKWEYIGMDTLGEPVMEYLCKNGI